MSGIGRCCGLLLVLAGAWACAPIQPSLEADNALISPAGRAMIGAHVRRCWSSRGPAADQQVRLLVLTDATDTIREARAVDAQDRPVTGPSAERAVRAALDPRCATLPLPPGMMGSNHTFEITFRP